MTLPDTERFRLLGGPYAAPPCKAGGWLTCHMRGRAKVAGMSNGPIPWPLVLVPRRGPPSLALVGDLVRAVQTESTKAIQHWWGVKSKGVWRWRQALGVTQNNAGTLRLRSKWWTGGGIDEAARPAREAALPEVYEAKRGKPGPRLQIDAMSKARLDKKLFGSDAEEDQRGGHGAQGVGGDRAEDERGGEGETGKVIGRFFSCP